MRRCRIDLPNRCYHLISRVAHRALEFGGLQAANRKGRYDKEKLLWQFTVAVKSDPVGSAQEAQVAVAALQADPFDNEAWEKAESDTVEFVKQWTKSCQLTNECTCAWGKK